MSSSRKFTPGSKAYNSRMIRYNAVYNELRRALNNDPTTPIFYYPSELQQKEIVCHCFNNIEKKTSPASQGTEANVSQNMIFAQRIRTPRSGSVTFGNFYLGEPLTLNYLGRLEGQSGGGGAPIRNQFR
jgi:hypothetical protein